MIDAFEYLDKHLTNFDDKGKSSFISSSAAERHMSTPKSNVSVKSS
jgi:hypothetical protein